MSHFPRTTKGCKDALAAFSQVLLPLGYKPAVFPHIPDKQKPDPGGERVIVLTKTPIVFEQLIDGGVDIKEVCLGGMGIRGDRKPFVNNVSASPEEVDSIRRMRQKGVNVYYQLVPEQKVVDISNLL